MTLEYILLSTIETWTPALCRQPPCVMQIDISGNGNINYVATITRCLDHSTFDGQSLVNMLLREDGQYQSGMNWVASSFPTKFISGNWDTPASGVFITWLTSGVPPNAVSTRVVHISGTGVGPNALAVRNLQIAMNTDLGSGQVLVSGSIV